MKRRSLKIISFTIVLSMFFGLNAVYGMDLQNNNADNQSYSTEDKLDAAINSIQNDVVKEKITDLYDIRYIEVAVEEGKGTSDANFLTDQQLVTNVESMAKMSEKQLDKAITKTVQDTINLIKSRSDVMLLPSSYEVFEKYNLSKELEEIKSLKQEVRASAAGSDMTIMAANKSYEKTGHGYIRTVVGDILMARYSMTVQWWTDSSNKIYFWDKYTAVQVNSSFYAYVTDKIVSEDLPDFYLGQRANIVAKCKLQKIDLLNLYDYLNLDVWFYNDGGLDCMYWES